MHPLFALTYAALQMQVAAAQTTAGIWLYAWAPHPPAELVSLDEYRRD